MRLACKSFIRVSKEILLRDLSVLRDELAQMKPSGLLGLLTSSEVLIQWAFGQSLDALTDVPTSTLKNQLNPVVESIAAEFDSRFQELAR